MLEVHIPPDKMLEVYISPVGDGILGSKRTIEFFGQRNHPEKAGQEPVSLAKRLFIRLLLLLLLLLLVVKKSSENRKKYIAGAS